MTTAVRSISAQGLLTYDNPAKSIACNATLTLQHDGDVELECTTPHRMVLEWVSGVIGAMPEPVRFEGTLPTGESLVVTGPLLGHFLGWDANNGTRASFALTGSARAQVTANPPLSTADWRFGIVNFAWSNRFQTSDAAPQVTFQIGGTSLVLNSLSDNNTSRLLSSASGVALTAELCIPGDLNQASELASDLCAILSLAEGTLVNWIYAEQLADDGTLQTGIYHSAVTRRYSGSLPLIDPNRSDELIAFVQQAYPTYHLRKHDYSLQTVTRAIADVRTRGFLETRCLQLLSAVECILSRDAEIHQAVHVMDDKVFQSGLAALSSQVRAALTSTFPDLPDGDLDTICGHLQGLNYRPFRKNLLATANRWGWSVDKSEVASLSRTRNDLVHRGRFSTGTPLAEFRRVTSVLDRLVMGLLEYRGPYIDARTFTRAQ